jgi:hypothetical protein
VRDAPVIVPLEFDSEHRRSCARIHGLDAAKPRAGRVPGLVAVRFLLAGAGIR